MMIHEIIDRGLKVGKDLGVDEIEIYVTRHRTTTIVGTIRGIERVEHGERIDVGVRLIVNKRIAVLGGLVSRLEDIDDLVHNAMKIAKSSKEDPNWKSLPTALSSSAVQNIVDPSIEKLELSKFLELMDYILKKPKDIDRRTYTSSSFIVLNFVERGIGNNHSEAVFDRYTEFTVFFNIKAIEDTEESGYYEIYMAPTLKELNIDILLNRAVDVAVKSLRAKAIETGSYEVLLMPRVFASIARTVLAPAISADWIQKKRSPLVGKIDQQIVSEKITVYDDGTKPNGLGTRAFDDEGVATRNKIVFDKGILKTYLYDTYTANIEGRESTGNAFRYTPTSTPIPWITNLVISNGTSSIDSLIRDVRKGIVVYATIGEWLSNPVNGFVNATISNGIYVENGEMKFGVKGMVINGNFYELLSKNIVELSKEVEGYLRVYAPAILLRDVVIAGK